MCLKFPSETETSFAESLERKTHGISSGALSVSGVSKCEISAHVP